MNTTMVYCAVNLAQLKAIVASDWRRLAFEQGQRYILLKSTMLAAAGMAEQWVAKREGQGFVITFGVDSEYLASLRCATVACNAQREHQLPVNAVAALQAQMHGRIQLITVYKGCAVNPSTAMLCA